MSKRFDWWCKTAVDQIRYGPDREEVYQELYAHLIDRYDMEIERCDEPREAEEAVLRAMGDANELAPMLAQVHRPFWGYVLTATRWAVRLGLGLVVLLTAAFLHYNWPQETYSYWFYENPGQPLVNKAEDGSFESTRLLDLEPHVRDSSDGFTFEVTRAVMVYHDSFLEGEDDFHSFFFQIEVSSFLQWAELRHMPDDEFWAVDSLGNVYCTYSRDGYTWQQSVIGNTHSTGFFTCTLDMWLSNFCSEDAEWIEIRYDRSGRDIRLRIDLTGGDTP